MFVEIFLLSYIRRSHILHAMLSVFRMPPFRRRAYSRTLSIATFVVDKRLSEGITTLLYVSILNVEHRLMYGLQPCTGGEPAPGLNLSLPVVYPQLKSSVVRPKCDPLFTLIRCIAHI